MANRRNTFAAICCILLMMSISVSGQNKDRRESFKSWDNYEISTERVGADGTKLIKVWGYGRTVDKAVMNAKENAVHACIFRGLPSSPNAMATPALYKGKYEDNADYFDNFFAAGGPYLAFINLTTDGMPSGKDNLKVKGGYKVGLYVQVMFDNLRLKLKEDGIIKGLDSGF